MHTSLTYEARGTCPCLPHPDILSTAPHRHQATPEIWQETYLSSLLRAILYSDDPNYFLEAYRRLEPISTPDAELRFLQAAEALFLKGAKITSPITHLSLNDIPIGI